MKIGNFIMLQRNPDATAAPAAPAKPEATSPKLDELRAKRKAAWQEMIKIEDGESDAAINAKMELWKIDGEINAEKQAIAKAEADAKLAEARNERLKLVSNLLDAHSAMLAVNADKKATDEQKATAKTNFETAEEIVKNELLAKFAGSTSARKPKVDGATETEKSSGKAERDAKLWPLFAEGKTAKQVQDETGENRSNVWFSLDRYRKANGIAN